MTTTLDIIARPAGAMEELNILGELGTVFVTGADTGGAYEVEAITSPPGGGPPAPHTHPPAETMIVLAGEYEFTGIGPDGPYHVRGTAGSAVHVPPGVPHNYKNIGPGEGRLIVIAAPEGMLAFHRALAALGAERPGPPDLDRLMAICREHNVEFVAPPGA
jgi:quercetin dioxygenase-like cupin family protein